MPLPGDQAFKSRVYGGHSYANHHTLQDHKAHKMKAEAQAGKACKGSHPGWAVVPLRSQSSAQALACSFLEASISIISSHSSLHTQVCMFVVLICWLGLVECAEGLSTGRRPSLGLSVCRVLRRTSSHLDSNMRSETGSGSKDISYQARPSDFIPGAHTVEGEK